MIGYRDLGKQFLSKYIIFVKKMYVDTNFSVLPLTLHFWLSKIFHLMQILDNDQLGFFCLNRIKFALASSHQRRCCDCSKWSRPCLILIPDLWSTYIISNQNHVNVVQSPVCDEEKTHKMEHVMLNIIGSKP